MKKKVFFLFFILIFTACTLSEKIRQVKGNNKEEDLFEKSIVSRITPRWFTGSRTFSLQAAQGGDAVHMLYDVNPSIDLEKYTLKFIAVTPEDSHFQFDLDMVSGQHFLKRRFCSQKDIWKKKSGSIHRPPYTLGYVPKMLDQLGTPQKIIVFGDKNLYQENFTSNFFEAKVVGGIIEQECIYGGCFNQNDWSSRIVLIGVQKNHPKYENVDDLEALKKKINWEKMIFFMENGQGNNQVVDDFYPGFRAGVEISRQRALSYLDRKSVILSNEKLVKMRKSCFKLYDFIHDSVYKKSKFESGVYKLKSIKDQVRFSNAFKGRSDVLFFKRFINAFRKYSDEYLTCIDYIYPSNINKDMKRHWFFAYYTAVHRLYQLGYSYDCGRNSWQRVVTFGGQLRSKKRSEEFEFCSAKDIDNAFVTSVKELEILGAQNYPTYRYIDYDNSSAGTHKKIYSWVKKSNKVFKCVDKRENKKQVKFEFFPKDALWERRRIKLNRDGLIIE